MPGVQGAPGQVERGADGTGSSVGGGPSGRRRRPRAASCGSDRPPVRGAGQVASARPAVRAASVHHRARAPHVQLPVHRGHDGGPDEGADDDAQRAEQQGQGEDVPPDELGADGLTPPRRGCPAAVTVASAAAGQSPARAGCSPGRARSGSACAGVRRRSSCAASRYRRPRCWSTSPHPSRCAPG